METAKKPEIKSTSATIHVSTESELIRMLNEKLPELTERINKNRKKARLSVLHMRYYHYFKNRGGKNDF